MLLISAGEKQRQEDSWAYRSGSVAHFVNHRPMGSFLSKKKKGRWYYSGHLRFSFGHHTSYTSYPSTQGRENERERSKTASRFRS